MGRSIKLLIILVNSIFTLGQTDLKSVDLQSVIEKTVDGKKVFGVSFAIKKDTFVWRGSAGNMSLDQPYFIASTTKLFTTSIILKLRADGKLSLDDKINKYLDQSILKDLHVFKGKDYADEITIKHLLAHTSGLPDYFQGEGTNGKSLEDEIVSGMDQFWTFEQAIERTKKMKALFAPGTDNKANYSDANFQLLGKIIENITDKTFIENCEALIIKPLYLTKTYMYDDTLDLIPKPLFYKSNELKIPKAMTSFGADGGVVSTSADMLIFIESFFTGKLFPKEYIIELQEWNKIFPPLQAGIGIHLFKLPGFFGMPELIGHSGLSGALAYYDPKDDIYVVGTVNQIAYPSQSFTVASKLIQTLLIEKKLKKIQTVSAFGFGTTYSSISNNGGTPKIGLALDLYKEYKILKPISFTAGINYIQRGEKSKNSLENIRLHYVDLPLMLRINIFKSKLGISSGISTNILLGSNKVKGTFQRVEYSVPFAVNCGIGDFMQISLKYNLGISEIGKNYYSNQGYKNNWFGISLLLFKP